MRRSLVWSVVGMWCSQCETDVAPASSQGAGEIRCLQCGERLENHGDATVAPELYDLSASLSAIPLDWDDWELDEDLRMAERLGRPLAPAAALPTTFPPAILPHPAVQRAAPTHSTEREPSPETAGFAVACAWVVLAIGLMAFVCGAVLLVWSFASGRDELLRLGAPLTLAGQTCWLTSMLVQMDRLWQSRRRATQEIAKLQVQVNDLATHLERTAA